MIAFILASIILTRFGPAFKKWLQELVPVRYGCDPSDFMEDIEDGWYDGLILEMVRLPEASEKTVLDVKCLLAEYMYMTVKRAKHVMKEEHYVCPTVFTHPRLVASMTGIMGILI